MRILTILDHPDTIASADNVPHRRRFSTAVDAAASGALTTKGA